MRKAQCQIATHAEIARLRRVAQRQLVGCYQLCYIIRILFAQHICHTLIIANGCTRMELKHFLMEWCIRHHIPPYIPWQHICIHGLHIAFAYLIIDGIIDQCILCQVGMQARHKTGEFLLIETGIHRKNIVIKCWLQTQITYCFVHGIRVVAHRFHLLNTRLIHSTTIHDSSKFLSAKLIAEAQVGRPVPSII